MDWHLLSLMPHIYAVRKLIPDAFVSYLSQLGWNHTILGFDDFQLVRAASHILYTEAELYRIAGAFDIIENVPIILLSSVLREPFKTFCAWHELSHYNLDSSLPCLFTDPTGREVIETRASLIAACALIPQHIVHSFTINDFMEILHYPPELVHFRRAVLKITGY